MNSRPVSENRQIIELLDSFSKRAMQIALHNLDELGIENESLPNKALFCFLIALEEHKRKESEQ
jgi:hypothetical protein